MTGRLQQELLQTRPFRTLEEETTLNILRTAEVLTLKLADVLRESDLSPTQYNVLRILRGAGAAGVTCKDISQRMVTPDPDITRLLDRLDKRGLISRDRAADDRRFITVRLTRTGSSVVSRLDEPVARLHRALLGGFEPARLQTLVGLLERVREHAEAPGAVPRSARE